MNPSPPYGPSCSTSVTPWLTNATLAPSREKIGLRTNDVPSWLAAGASSKKAGSQIGWAGNNCHNSGSMPLLDRIAFQGGSIQRVGAFARLAPKASWNIHSQG